MCLGMNVNLPTVGSFLLLYSLRCGSTVVLIWTLLRASFLLFFFVIVLLEALVRKKSPFGLIFVHSDQYTTEDYVFHLYYCSIVMIIAESFLIIFCLYLCIGVICVKASPIPQYLTCRFIVWLLEITNLTVLTLVHKQLIGWYLGTLMFIILEFYGFLIVYSYYVELVECCDNSRSCKPCY